MSDEERTVSITGMRRITTFRSPTGRIYDGGPVRLYYNILIVLQLLTVFSTVTNYRVQLKRDGTRRRSEGEVKTKLANGVGSQYSSHYLGTWCIQHYYR